MGALTRFYLSHFLHNPFYAQIDLEMCEFFKSNGTVVVKDIADFVEHTVAISIRAQKCITIYSNFSLIKQAHHLISLSARLISPHLRINHYLPTEVPLFSLPAFT